MRVFLWIWILVPCDMLCGGSLLGNAALSAEKKLIGSLIKKYKQAGVSGRPVRNISQPLTVYFGLGLVQILDIDEKNQVLTISAWLRYIWHDYLLSWNRSEYDGVEMVRIPTKDIWLPDIALYNYADERMQERREALAVLTHDGNVLWVPQAIFKSSCTIDITNFPFDTQICHLKFGSWTYDGFKLQLEFFQESPYIDLSNYVMSNEWDVIGNPAQINIVKYPCCLEPYPDITFTLVIKRRGSFYSFVLILPCILLSLLTVVLFWLPPESPAKMQLGLHVFLAYFLMLLVLAESVPHGVGHAVVPLIGAYYCVNMLLTTASTFLAAFVIHLYVRADRSGKVPPWLNKVVIKGLARVLFMSNYMHDRRMNTEALEKYAESSPIIVRKKS